MGFGWQELLIVAVIVVLLFGTKKLRGIGSDLGGAVKGFKKAMKEEDKTPEVENKKDETFNAKESSEKDKEKDKA